jgi:predicted TIM-barrel fold metal-dependent hydrolase
VTESERYERIDLPFYESAIRPALPPEILDFHVHLWERGHWRSRPSEDGSPGGRYMVVAPDYAVADLEADLARVFPDRPCRAVCFGMPTPAADTDRANRDLASSAAAGSRYPLLVAGKGTHAPERLEELFASGAFWGYKVYLPWHGDAYGATRVADMIGHAEMAIAERRRLVVLLHVPGAGRLADPAVQEGVRALASSWPGAQIVLAHCGRCYLPDEMRRAAPFLRDLGNVSLDTAMVMDPTVLQIALEAVGPSRILYATDLPVARMRGRRVYAMDHWVDLVLPPEPESAYRVQAEGIRATFMVYEIVLAILRAAQRLGLGAEDLAGIFFGNGMRLLERVRRGA